MNAFIETDDLNGLMFIGDPHLESRVPGFRKDDFPKVALEKFRWCLQYAVENRFQPFLLGDLFQLPQGNPNWLISSIIEIITETLRGPLPTIYGNHDVRENSLKPNDSIRISLASGQLQHVSEVAPWLGRVRGRQVVVGGTTWGEALPKSAPADFPSSELTIWMTHHDILIPGYEEGGRIRPKELPGIDLVINGHIHRRLQTVSKGNTHWMTPGNITRRTRGDASRAHRPAVLCIRPRVANQSVAAGQSVAADQEVAADHAVEDADVFDFVSRAATAWRAQWVVVPHASFDDVFYPQMADDAAEDAVGSGFIAQLRELTGRRTDSGAGLSEFLDQHLPHFEDDVADEIRRLAREVTQL